MPDDAPVTQATFVGLPEGEEEDISLAGDVERARRRSGERRGRRWRGMVRIGWVVLIWFRRLAGGLESRWW